MRHWDELIALKQRIGVSRDYRPAPHHHFSPVTMSDKQRITDVVFENMTPQDQRFLNQKFHLETLDSISASLEQQITTCMRIDLFYQTAECRLIRHGDGYRLRLIAGSRKSSQIHVGARYDNEEYAAVQINADFRLKRHVPMDADVTLRLGKRLMAKSEFTFHPNSFTRPTLGFAFNHNNIDIYSEGDLSHSLLYNHFQAHFTPFNFNLRHFNLQLGVHWDYMHYNNHLEATPSEAQSIKNQRFYSYHARMEYNSENDWYFATRGIRFQAEYAYLTDDFVRLEGRRGLSQYSAHWRKSFTIGSRFTLQPMVYGRLLF